MNVNKSLLALLLFFAVSLNFVFSQNLTYSWSNVPFGNNNFVTTSGLASDNVGNTYEVGRITQFGTIDFDPGPGTYNISNGTADQRIFIRKLDANGALLWIKTAQASSSGSPASGLFVRSVVVDQNQNVIVSGEYYGVANFSPGGTLTSTPFNGTNGFVYKLDPSGNLLWLKDLRTLSSGGDTECYDLMIDAFNNVIVGGRFRGTVDFDPSVTTSFNLSSGSANVSFLLRLTENGDLVNAVKIGSNATCNFYEFEKDANDNLFCVFDYSYSTGGNDVDPGLGISTFSSSGKILIIFNSDFSFGWAHKLVSYSVNSACYLTVDNVGSVIVSVPFKGSLDFDPGPSTNIFSSFSASTWGLCISKFSSNGTYLWTKQFVANDDITCFDLVMDSHNNFYLFLGYNGNVDIDPGPSNLILTDLTGSNDSFLGKYNSDGELQEHYVYTNNSGSAHIAPAELLPTNSAFYMAGYIRESWDADPSIGTALMSGSTNSSFIVKYLHCANDSSFTASACDSYTWNGSTYTSSGSYTQTFTNVTNCDSTVTLNLTINNSATSTTAVTACDSYTWNGTNYTATGVYTWNGTNAAGCDSTATLNLTINNSTTASESQTACDSYTWALNGTTYTSSGTYTHVGTNAAGCPLTTTLNLTINNSTTASESQTACDSYTWALNGTTYTSSGTYTHVGTNANGCPHTTTLNLTINNSTTASVSQTSCDSYTWALNGTSYTSSGTYTHVGTSANGCPHTTTLNLTINNSTTASVSQTSCDSYTWPLNGTSYTSSGTYTHLGTNANGCPLTTTLNLTINNSTTASESQTACDSYTWALNGTTYTSSGTYTHVGTNANGCLLTTTLNLTINNSTTASESQTTCDSYTWALNGTTYTSSGTYTHVGTNAAGCQLTTTLNLTINTVNSIASAAGNTITVNEAGASYQWVDCNNANSPINGANAQSFTPTSNGSYAVIVTKNGCSETSNCVVINTIGVSEIENSSILVYPNPSNGEFVVDFGTVTGTKELIVTDLTGKIVYNIKTDLTSLPIELDIAKGAYQVMIISENHSARFSKKLIIQ